MCCNSPFSEIPLATNHLWQGGFLIYKDGGHIIPFFFFSVSSASSVVKIVVKTVVKQILINED